MGRGPKPQQRLTLTDQELQELRKTSRLRKAPYAEVIRAKILLLAFEQPDWTNVAIARRLGCTDREVRKWRSRWVESHSIGEAARPGAPRFFSL